MCVVNVGVVHGVCVCVCVCVVNVGVVHGVVCVCVCVCVCVYYPCLLIPHRMADGEAMHTA